MHGRPAKFPGLMEPEEFIAPLRYIASRSEFQKLTQAVHPKQSLDAFWLACSPSPENARNLLNTYYGRVEEANANFSGWSKDGAATGAWCTSCLGCPNASVATRGTNTGSTAKNLTRMP